MLEPAAAAPPLPTVPRPRHTVDGSRPVGAARPSTPAVRRPRVTRRRIASMVVLTLLVTGLAVPALLAADSASEVPVGFASSPTADGYWVVWPNGRVEAKGQTTTYGDATGFPLSKPVVGMAATKSGKGYWLVASDGGIFSFGDARFFGSTGGIRLNQPITGIATTPSGNGYWMVASDGGVFSFGDARFFGSTGGIPLNSPISSMAATKSGGGYWLAAIDGGVFAFGDAPFVGSTGGSATSNWIRGVTPTNTGRGYWLAGVDGSVFAYGDATNPMLTPVMVGIARAGSGWTAVMSHKPGVTPVQPTPTTKPTGTTPTTKKPTTPTTTPTTPTTTAPPPANAYAPPASIDRTGTRDVTVELQRFLDTIPHHSVINFPAGAKYRIEGTLVLEKLNDIVIHGNGAKLFANDPIGTEANTRIRSQFDFRNMSNLLVEDLVIRGAHTNGGQDDDAYVAAREAQHGINVIGGERIELRDLTITDVYGDFIYVGGSPSPIFGSPTDIWIHDNYMRRNGRQGISATHGYNIVIERNDISDTRRATFDLEPASERGSIRNVYIRNNRVGPGRLNFVAGHGSGNASDVYITDNVLHGHSMGVDFVAPGGTRRQNIVLTGNTSDLPEGNGRGVMVRFVGYDYLDIRNNTLVAQQGRDMVMAGLQRSCAATVSGNDLGPYGVGQIKYLDETPYVCGTVPPLVKPSPPDWFTGEHLAIDVGGSTPGMIACPSTTNCGGFYTGGAATALRASSTGTVAQNTMLHGDLHFDIPIRSGAYRLTLTFVEPTLDISARRFHVQFDDRIRLESSFDVNKEAGGKNKLVTHTYDVVIGDGVMDLDFEPGGTGANGPILSMIEIDRA